MLWTPPSGNLCAWISGNGGGDLPQSPDVDGILCSNDVIAAEIIQYCRRHEIDIPGRLKLIGYDDTRLASLCSPQLTSIHQPVEDICRYAVESILHASQRRSRTHLRGIPRHAGNARDYLTGSALDAALHNAFQNLLLTVGLRRPAWAECFMIRPTIIGE